MSVSVENYKPGGSSRPPQKVGSPDDFQTPPEALLPLYPFLKSEWTIWEPACGKGNLVGALIGKGYRVKGSDVLQDPRNDFLTLRVACDAILTNPPFSLKDEFLARCYDIGKPFALLLPLTALEGLKRQALYRKYGMELIVMPRRINFETPSGQGSGSWFASAWYTWGLNVGSALTFWEASNGQGRLGL